VPSKSVENKRKIDIDMLPAMILSSSPERLDTLFTLLESSEPSLVNEIWELICRLPSSPYSMTKWLKLEGSTVEKMLFSSSQTYKGNDISVSKLLYNLQLVEALLQPSSHPLNGEGTSIWGYKYIDLDAINRWPATFLAKGGFEAVFKVYIHLFIFIYIYICIYKYMYI
jgi:hypothetical protein